MGGETAALGHGQHQRPSMPAHLFVLSFIRVAQIAVCLVLLWKCLGLRSESWIDMYCGSRSVGSVHCSLSFPFVAVSAEVTGGCRSSDANVTRSESLATGLALTSGLALTLLAASVLLALLGLGVYVCGHTAYEADKKWPLADLLASLALGLGWAGASWSAYARWPDLRESANADHVIARLSACASDEGVYCNESSGQESGSALDASAASHLLFLALGAALSCGVAAWFVVVETRLCPDDEADDEDDQTDLEYEVLEREQQQQQPLARLLAKEQMGCSVSQQEQQLLQAHLAQYLSQWRERPSNKDLDDDRFAAGLTFAPMTSSVATVATPSERKRDLIGNRLHNTFNLFRA